MSRPVRLLTFTNLFPNEHQPAHGLFVYRRLSRIVATRSVEAVVVAPVPMWRRDGSALPARSEQRDELTVHHPRFATIPGLGRFIAPFSMAFASLGVVRKLARRGEIDIVDAHYFYPDGVAAAALAWVLRKPLVVTARGTDINVLPNFLLSRALIRWAAKRAAKVVTVSEALRRRLIDLGVDATKVVTLRNGVDRTEFHALDRDAVRARLQLPAGLILLSVGSLIESKGHHLAIEALGLLPDAYLVIVGSGPMRSSLERLADQLGVGDRVRFAGVLETKSLVEYYNAADVLVLASEREGMPNVLLEATSCGLPVVATNCGGVAEVVDSPQMGVMMDERSARGIATAVRALLARQPSRADTREAAGRFDWNCTVQRQIALYATIAGTAA